MFRLNNFRELNREILDKNFNTSYVSVKREEDGEWLCIELYFNTSYVSVKLFPFCFSKVKKSISIHHMFRLNRETLFRAGACPPDFNTSYVSVKLFSVFFEKFFFNYFNTSYVSVKLKDFNAIESERL